MRLVKVCVCFRSSTPCIVFVPQSTVHQCSNVSELCPVGRRIGLLPSHLPGSGCWSPGQDTQMGLPVAGGRVRGDTRWGRPGTLLTVILLLLLLLCVALLGLVWLWTGGDRAGSGVRVGGAACSLLPDPGPCRARLASWYYLPRIQVPLYTALCCAGREMISWRNCSFKRESYYFFATYVFPRCIWFAV